MPYVLKKRGKYMAGHGYASGFGYCFSWSPDIKNARLFLNKDRNNASHWASESDALIIFLRRKPT